MKILYSFVVFVFLVVSACSSGSDEESMARVGGRWACKIEKQYQCTQDGCTSRTPRVAIIIDFDNGKFDRCTGSACDSYSFQFHEDLLLSVLVGKMEMARGAHFVVDNDGTNFVESVSRGAWTNNLFGTCTPEITTE